ncbi:DUF4262 domain-containing protein [Roseovarius aestuarii]|uniref:DUF4262 domain-containing protein n=1 Tax=Roseovarius aestuarii TaxID=475083 RepID=UPI00111C2E76|nr:DUF4262 domain-containing protein [Roseovarius aestuarii]
MRIGKNTNRYEMRRIRKLFTSLKKYSDQERDILSTVEQYGWLFRFVFDADGEDPDFGYSVGFTKSLDAPEFIVFGLQKDLMHHMLGEVYHQMESGRRPEDGMQWDDLLEGFQCISRKAIRRDLHTKYTTAADWLWRDSGNKGEPEVYQLVWPGAQQGLFPWEEGCQKNVIDLQPHLWDQLD